MNAVLTPQGQLVLPEPVRERLHLLPGDDFEVAIEDQDTFTLRRVSVPPNRGLVDLLISCPAPLNLVLRDGDDSQAPAL